MSNFKANERTFQGVLLSTLNKIIDDTPEIKFESAFQELNVGVGESRFSDAIIFSSVDSKLKVFFELKNSSWDATDEFLVNDAMLKAFNQGIEYFVTGTPRQLVLFKTFQPNTTPLDRKLKLYELSNVRTDNEVITSLYKTQIHSTAKQFLQELSDLIHGIKDIHWDSIDKQFINKLSAYILEASVQMSEEMIPRIKNDNNLRKQIREYIKLQEIFHVSINFYNEDIYNLSQLANYLLYLKIIFYSYLQRDVHELNLKVLSIPEDKELLNKVLRERFNDVLVYDYESIFKETVLDNFSYPEKYIPELKRNVEQIKKLEFHDLSLDVIGSIYNSLIENQEQHDRGQHFTNTDEVDIVNAFCINKDTKTVFDTGCGAGTFLVRAYAFMKYFNNSINHINLLERLWGVDIAPFPVLLASMNLSLLSIKELQNYPVIINNDFSKIKTNSYQKLIFANKTKIFEVIDEEGKYKKVKIPKFDTCVGNPPYIRQELIEEKTNWTKLVMREHHIKKINQQSDLYVYYLMHTTAFLKESGRLGYVISSSWLDVAFGTVLQKFLLDNFKIIAIFDNQIVRSFGTASVNTVILILEKCKIREEREKNIVRFVRIFHDYKNLIGQSSSPDRIKNVLRFCSIIEKTKNNVKNKNYLITTHIQKDLEEASTINGKYNNGNWGARYLRSPDIYNKIITTAGDKLIPLNKIAEVKYCIKSGSNDFFYVIDETQKVKELTDDEFMLQFGFARSNSRINWEKYGWYYSKLTKSHHLMERRFFKPLFKTQREALNLDVDLTRLKYCVLLCNESFSTLKKYKTKISKYIEIAEGQYNLHLKPTNAQRVSTGNGNGNGNGKYLERAWFNLGEEFIVGDFIFPSKIGEKFRLIDNRKSKVYCDKVNYNIVLNKEIIKNAWFIFLILNSTLFRYLIDLFARQLTGNQTISDVDVIVVENALIINPQLLIPYKSELKKVYNSLKKREQLSIYEEVKQDDRRKLDEIIFEALGLEKKDLNELYKQSCAYIKQREMHSASVKMIKKKQKLDYQTSVKLIKERFPEINSYMTLTENIILEDFRIPNLPAKFPKNINVGDSNFFNAYNVYFIDDNRQIKVSFKSNSQLKLFDFFYNKLEIKGTKLFLPTAPEDCEKIYSILFSDFKNYNSQIKGVLKSLRSSASYLSVYKDLVMS